MNHFWYLVQSKPRQEGRASEHLIHQGYEVFCPQIQVEKIRHGHLTVQSEPMFSGYLFVKLSQSHQTWAPIHSTRGVMRLVRFGLLPARLADTEIKALASWASQIQRRYLSPGQLVNIVSGSLKGAQAIFKRLVQAKNGQERALILIEMMGVNHPLTIDLDAIRVA